MIRNMKDDERDVCLLFVCFLLLPPCKMWGVMMVEMPKCNWFLFFFFLIFWWFHMFRKFSCSPVYGEYDHNVIMGLFFHRFCVSGI